MARKKVCFVVSTPHTAKSFLTNHIAALAKDYAVTLVANYSDNSLPLDFIAGVDAVDIRIVRNIDVASDLVALYRLYQFFRSEEFSAVHSVTPKAGLLAMVASFFAGISLRYHTFTGQVWATKRGAFRFLLKSLDKLIFSMATHVLVDSPSQRQFLIDHGVVSSGRSSVLGDGSIAGVDLQRFRPNVQSRVAVREQYGIPHDAFIFLYLGRMNMEKGVGELIDAFSLLKKSNRTAFLLLVGPDEDRVLNEKESVISHLPGRVLREGYTSTPEFFMAAADVFCLPSHREGFGTVILEAAASGVPSVGSNIYGVTDAIVDGYSGLLHKVKDAADLAEKMQVLLDDHELLDRFGRNALERARSSFSVERIVNDFVSFYRANV